MKNIQYPKALSNKNIFLFIFFLLPVEFWSLYGQHLAIHRCIHSYMLKSKNGDMSLAGYCVLTGDTWGCLNTWKVTAVQPTNFHRAPIFQLKFESGRIDRANNGLNFSRFCRKLSRFKMHCLGIPLTMYLRREGAKKMSQSHDHCWLSVVTWWGASPASSRSLVDTKSSPSAQKALPPTDTFM